jgi:hypothetical protein
VITLTRRSLTFILSCYTPLLAAKKKSQTKEPEIVLLDAVAKVEDARVVVDGHVRNTSDKPIRRLTVIYEVLDSDKKVLTRQKGPIDQETLEPGEEAQFSAQMQYHARVELLPACM